MAVLTVTQRTEGVVCETSMAVLEELDTGPKDGTYSVQQELLA